MRWRRVVFRASTLKDLCFEAQQVAEKAIKSVMMTRKIEFPFGHDLSRLLSLLEQGGETIPGEVLQAQNLTDYATVTRYPGTAEPVSEQEYAEAIRTTEAVVQWAEALHDSPRL